MEPLEYLRILRRRWVLIALVAFAGVAIGFVTAPGSASTVKRYSATHTLILNPQIDPKTFNVEQAALQAISGAVPDDVARKLGGNQDSARLAASVRSIPNAKIGTIALTCTDTDPQRAVTVCDRRRAEPRPHRELRPAGH
jgi:capsular polysaccharide biosynthesis protein